MLRRLDYRPYPFNVKYASFSFELDEERTLVRATLFMERKAEFSANEPLVLNLGKDVPLEELSINGEALAPCEYSRVDETITILLESHGIFRVDSVVRLNPSANKTGEGLYITDGMFCTQCEAKGFRQITLYPDRPDVLAPITTMVIADPKYPTLLSNGNKTKEGMTKGGRRFVVWEDPAPKPCYIFALVAGKLACMEDEFVTMSGRHVALKLYSDNAETLATCAFAMESLKKAMRWDEVAFGREYDLDLYMVVAVSSFNMGAMENRGLNVFNLKYVSGDRHTATDSALAGIEGVIGHEYFHNWSGNLVTCRDWFELSLKEGFTVMRDQEFSRSTWGLSKMLSDVRMLRDFQFAEDAGPLAHPVRPDEAEEIDNFYTDTVYDKGAEVVRMIRTILGPETFRRGTDLYFSRHLGSAATCEDFVRAMEDVSKVDLGQFRRWYSQAGTPTVSVRMSRDEKTEMLKLHVKQSCPPTSGQPTKEPFHIPLRIGFLDAAGNDQDVALIGSSAFDQKTGVLHITQAEETFVFRGVSAESVPSFNRGFSAPVKMDYPYAMEELFFLVRHDSDEFNRWDAWQSAAMRTLRLIISESGHRETLHTSERLVSAFVGAFGELMGGYGNAQIAPTLFSEMFVLPSEEAIANACEVVDPFAIHTARESLKGLICKRYYRELTQLYKVSSEPYVFDTEHVARRRIKNTCLSYLSAAQGGSFLQSAIPQFETADNMTDELAALTVLADSPLRSQKETVAAAVITTSLESFYQKHKGDRNVVDSWFLVQASSPLSDLAAIKALMKHPEFSMQVPNRVRAVIGAFAMRNPVQFHHESGSGYVFFADMIRELDAFNPQVAARLVEPLTEWRRYGEKRQELMRGELVRLKAGGVSKGVMEKIEKSLA